MPTIENLRKQIDAVDAEIIRQLSRRFKLTHEVGKYKKKHNLKPYDKKREMEMFKTRIALEKKRWDWKKIL
jgi:chorismate mutase